MTQTSLTRSKYPHTRAIQWNGHRFIIATEWCVCVWVRAPDVWTASRCGHRRNRTKSKVNIDVETIFTVNFSEKKKRIGIPIDVNAGLVGRDQPTHCIHTLFGNSFHNNWLAHFALLPINRSAFLRFQIALYWIAYFIWTLNTPWLYPHVFWRENQTVEMK